MDKVWLAVCIVIICYGLKCTPDVSVLWIFLCGREQIGNIYRFNIVVAVNKDDIFTFCKGKSSISCRGNAAVGLMYNADPVIPCCVGIAKGPTLVRRAIVYQDQFEIRFRLAQNTVDAIRKVILSKIDRNNNRDFHRYVV